VTERFDSDVSAGADVTPTLTVNDQPVSNSLTFTLKESVSSTTGVTPSFVSPVIKQQLTIQLEATFPHVLQRDDFTVKVINTEDATIEKHLRVVSVDDAAKTMNVMFGGAVSGTYAFDIRHTDYGIVGTEGVTL
jgi:hypothetical protein